ncbi:hypothetical protein [Paracoccus sp. MC1862]|uniref:hypothetical protein n=1 Tax=Paracoccus sp. MC1862 TaxID=2760307 RepID=UPI0016009ABB|nr:hypothetical protein [Paracoccus sp. MC1862]MBB1498547.1 hypothetical protein [Paracoccus sp. MC1862]QQO44197.1 hypothetical protein JGR78_12465 [Paracoccus sp. MC1862]
MIFALRRDIAPLGGAVLLDNAQCEDLTGTENGNENSALEAGKVRLRDCERPRPLTLRANVGDRLVLRVTNLLMQPAPDFSADFCGVTGENDPVRGAVRAGVSQGNTGHVAHGHAACQPPDGRHAADGAHDWPATRHLNLVIQGLTPVPHDDPRDGPGNPVIHPACRGIDAVGPNDHFYCAYRILREGPMFFASTAAPAGGEGDGGSLVHGLFGAVLAERKGSTWYRSQTSRAAFDKAWLPAAHDRPLHSRADGIDYEKADDKGIPYLNMLRPLEGPQAGVLSAARAEIVHADLNAIVYCGATGGDADCRITGEDGQDSGPGLRNRDPAQPPVLAFREFSVFFHDELKTFYTSNFEELGDFGQLAGVRDGFAINYGASGMGSLLLANRKGIGPAADCTECLYEEFFLTSWANGDPALLEWYDDDPSNVHHSYLNDPVVFRNFHAGPKETHVFHLHAHQWFAGNDPNRGSYLDSQTVAPQQGFSYNIYHGGRRRPNGEGQGWWGHQGSGNRNRTVGDSIFHCHLYPHFAQGMWALWRVHDVLEDGTRLLPDGQPEPGLSLGFRPPGADRRPGSVDPNGNWLRGAAGTPIPAVIPLPGEPLPLLPGYADAPDWDEAKSGPAEPDAPEAFDPDAEVAAMPGYPFYIAGEAGHRPPQAPLDLARRLGGPEPDQSSESPVDTRSPVAGAWLDGGLPRHVMLDGSERELSFDPLPSGVTARLQDAALPAAERAALLRQVVARSLAMGDMTLDLTRARLRVLDPEGTPLERAAMGFHHNGLVHRPEAAAPLPLALSQPDGNEVTLDTGTGASGSYPTRAAPYPTRAAPYPASAPGPGPVASPVFAVNGSPPRPGAPFADPCGIPPAEAIGPSRTDPLAGGPYAPDPDLTGFRRYEVSAVQLDMIVNTAGWHDPQARINVLSARSPVYKQGRGRISPRISDSEEPFFFRALSGECIEFRHTNELPRTLELDDFQVRTPTDTIGQHIHLVKFDVTSSDGSGNGWNYEDGTFAADEIAHRRCATTAPGGGVEGGALTRSTDGECENGKPRAHDIWKKPLPEARDRFQTTVQRWFADPILSSVAAGTDRTRDRTLRTVFTHDHFGPSSIQQHGFYSALVVEPEARPLADVSNPDVPQPPGDGFGRLTHGLQSVCDPSGPAGCYRPLAAEALSTVAFGTASMVGASRTVQLWHQDGEQDYRALTPDFREYALAIADFALLYDPRDRISETELRRRIRTSSTGSLGGMATLACELHWRNSPRSLASVCGADLSRDARGHWMSPGEDVPPAWEAQGRIGDTPAHRTGLGNDLLTQADLKRLTDHLVAYRRNAAGMPAAPASARALASPVAPPQRPESISVDHHDPYLVNYRGEPIPLRIGDKDAAGGSRAGRPETRPPALTYDENGNRAAREPPGFGPFLPPPGARPAPSGPQPWPSHAASVHSRDCRPFRMDRPGREGAGPSQVEAALDPGARLRDRFPLCSVDRQLAGYRGDMGLALSSHVHGDPATPLLESYEGESIQVRLIQGAQEVQHVFRVLGQPFRRNADQPFPRAALALDPQPGPTRHRLCAEAMSDGRPEDYRRWLERGLKEFDPPQSPADREFWERHEWLLAHCDNPEGFTFVQEVGISEHFEMRGTLRSDVGSGPFELAPAGPFASSSAAAASRSSDVTDRDGHRVPEGVADSLYDFGSIDATWNGAWGLVRTYRDAATLDPATGRQIGSRLRPIGEGGARGQAFRSSTESADAPEPVPPASSGLSCPAKPVSGIITHRSESVIVALQTRDIWPEGTDYGMGRHDPDGLMLALLRPEALGGNVGFHDENWGSGLSRDTVLKAVKTAYHRGPEPFVMRVNAGDCVTLRFVNLLRDEGRRGGLRDLLGDARMPPIVPLNTDPAVRADGPEGRPRRMILDRPGPGLPDGGLRPSARMGLRIGLPALDLLRDLPLGVGFSAGALPPASDKRVSIGPILQFFAGRYRVDPELKLPDVLDEQLRLSLLQAAGGQDGNGSDLYPAWKQLAGRLKPNVIVGVHEVQPGEDFLFEVMGRRFGIALSDPDSGQSAQLPGSDATVIGSLCAALPCVTDHDALLGDLVGDLERAAGLEARQAVTDRIHWIPYAFGPVPVTSTADVISHVPHGMMGVIDVVPVDWDLSAADPARTTLPPFVDGFPRRSIGHVPAGAGLPTRRIEILPASRPGPMPVDLPATRLREFVLFWQDGLNLHASDSRTKWLWDDGIPVRNVRPVADCLVCDDSYDLGEAGVNYAAPGFDRMLRRRLGIDAEAQDDLNPVKFPRDFFDPASSPKPIVLEACGGEEVVIRVVHPGGRARQRAFVMNGFAYDDLFPGFGFPNAALLAPGKSVSAWLTPSLRAGDVALWFDGPLTRRAQGVWGLIVARKPGETLGSTGESC